ncbi:hypothetical protein FOZ62_027433, partial [Perkinsus olseni]
MAEERHRPLLLVDKHEKYIYDLDTPEKAVTMDYVLSESIRMGGAYWGITALDVMGRLDPQTYTRRDDVLDFVKSCRGQDGGYGFFPGMDSHINSTHYALLVLAELDALDTLTEGERLDTRRFVISVQTSDGGFQGDYSGEVDGRFSYSAVAILSLLDSVGSIEEGEGNDIDRQKAIAWLRSCQNYDGAFGSIPGAESHAAYTFCAVAALALLGEKADKNDDWRLGHWLAERQIPKHGGFNGRPEKAPDVCYSWWITSALAVLGKLHWIDSDALTGFILRAQEEDEGLEMYRMCSTHSSALPALVFSIEVDLSICVGWIQCGPCLWRRYGDWAFPHGKALLFGLQRDAFYRVSQGSPSSMSLADSFLADLDDVLDVRTTAEDTEGDETKIVEGGDEEDEEKLPVEGEEKEEEEPSVGVSQLLADEDFLSTMQRIRDASSAMESGEEDEEMKDGNNTAGASAEAGSLEGTAGTKKAEYELLSKCNTVAVTIDEDIYHIHRYVKKVVYWPVEGVLLADGGSVGLALVYSKKFPELESIVSMPLDYMRVVQRLIEKEEAGVFGNASGPNATLDMSKVDLSDLLPNNVIVAVTVTATSSAGSGVRLPARENAELLANITAANDLADCKNDIMIFLQGQMAKHAPNLNSLLGAPLAARLISSAGGVDKLAIMPSQNIEHVGAQKKQLS